MPLCVAFGYKHPRMAYGEDVDFVIDNFIDDTIGVADDLPFIASHPHESSLVSFHPSPA